METVSSVKVNEMRRNVWNTFRSESGSLISLAVPLVAGFLSGAFVWLINTYFLGPFGEVPLAAVSLTTSALIILFSALFGFLGPIGYLVGTAYGAGTRQKSRK